ncbi:lactate utilization protein [Chloroflexota bacterium]
MNQKKGKLDESKEWYRKTLNQRMDKLAETREWYKETLARRVIKSLERNNMAGVYVRTKEEALDKVINLIPEGSKVGLGGSLSLEQIGLQEVLRAGNYRFVEREAPGLSEDEAQELRKESITADVFLTSTNALTMDGKLVNIDGSGNRVAAISFGPGKVIVVAGINKIVPDFEAAIRRIKDYVTPIHAGRRDRPVPCAQTGVCVDCHTPARMCNVVCIIENQRYKDRMTIIIVGEELGL